MDQGVRRLLDDHAGSLVQYTNERLLAFESLARGVRGFVEGSDEINAREFQAYVASVQLDKTAPGLLGLGFVSRVEAGQRAALVERAGAQHGQPYVLHPPGERTVYAPITYFEPLSDRNRGALGFDLLTNPQAQLALQAALGTEELVLSERIRLVQDGPPTTAAPMAYVIYLSAFRPGSRRAQQPASVQGLIGWVSAPFRLRDVVAAGAARLPSGLTISLSEEQSSDGRVEAVAVTDGGVRLLDTPSQGASAFAAKQRIEFGGQRWTILVTPDAGFLASHRERAHDLVAIVGALLCLTVALIVWLLSTSRQRAMALAERMTAQLRAVSVEMAGTLNALPDRLIELKEDGTCLSFRFNAKQGAALAGALLVGKRPHEVLPAPAADGILAAIREAKEAGLSQGRVVSIPGRFTPRWFELSVARTDAEDEASHRYILIARDISDRVQASQVLEASQKVLAEAQRVAAVGHFWVDTPSQRWIGASSACDLWGLPSEGAMPLAELAAMVDERQRDAFMAFCLRGSAREHADLEFRICRADSRESRWLVVRKRADVSVPGNANEGGSEALDFFIVQDITERRNADAQLRLLGKAIASLHDIVIITEAEPITDPGPRIVFVNQAFERIMGYARDEVIGRSPRILQGPGTDRQECDRIRRALERWQPVRATLLNYTKSGEEVWIELDIQPIADEKGWFTHWVSVERDITQRKAIEAQVHQLAYFDVLTGLPNRVHFLAFAKTAYQLTQDRRTLGATLLIDLDNFKVVNDTWGHRSGDELLKSVAARLRAVVPDGGEVARLGGDEFIVIIGDLGDQLEAAQSRVRSLCDTLLAALASPVDIEGRAHVCTASIGIAMFGESIAPVDDLLRRADSAMYAAKAAGRNAYHFFDEQLQQELELKANFEADLRLALDRDQLHLVYQPKVDRQGRVVSVEALCRWRHPERGNVPPSLFIPMAESCGLIYRMGMWILRRALEDLQAWSQQPVTRDLALAVNVSARQFHHPGFVEEAMAVINEAAVQPGQLTLELTESVVAEDVASIVQTMALLRQRGVRFSLDDFGTGYSSLSYLRQLPLNEVKIDRSFVINVAESPADESVVQTVVALASSLGFSVVAEGVETVDQHRVLLASGCDLFQGYLFFKPMSAVQLAAAMANLPVGQ